MRQFIRKNIWAVAPVVLVLMALALLGSPLSSKVQETPAEDDNLIHSGRFHQGKRLHADF